MEYKAEVHKGMLIGAVIFVVACALSWYLVPDPIEPSSIYWLRFTFLYSIPLLFGVLLVVLARYRSDVLIKGSLSSNSGIELERAFLQNTLEQTLIALPIVVSFGVMAPSSYIKAIPVHALVFILGRFVFWFGYKQSWSGRLPGFIITNYANVVLFLGCIYLVFNA